jgi:hypothetical protein
VCAAASWEVSPTLTLLSDYLTWRAQFCPCKYCSIQLKIQLDVYSVYVCVCVCVCACVCFNSCEGGEERVFRIGLSHDEQYYINFNT